MKDEQNANLVLTKGKKLRLAVDYVVADTYIEAEERYDAIVRGITTPQLDQYGGATVTLATDGANTEYIAFCARFLPTGVFGFYIINLRTMQQVPYTPFCTGRGSISNAGKWVAWTNKDYYKGFISGFAPYPAPRDFSPEIATLQQLVNTQANTIATLQQQIAQIETMLANISTETISPQDRLALDRLRTGSDHY